ncbi:MAG TPA: sigma factor-like helix-turn-helix DNA-binding protein [Kribbellaceae bacterium]|jgi:DNA-directed RNA polymerase specialized sigma24 family protein
MRKSVDAEFAGYVASRQQQLLRAAYLVCGDERRARELVRRALTELAVHWDRLRDANPDDFVNRVLYDDAVSWWHHRHHGGRPAGSDVVRRALAALTPRQRAVLVLKYFDEQTEPEIASQLDLPLGTVQHQAALAVERFEAALAQPLEDAR